MNSTAKLKSGFEISRKCTLPIFNHHGVVYVDGTDVKVYQFEPHGTELVTLEAFLQGHGYTIENYHEMSNYNINSRVKNRDYSYSLSHCNCEDFAKFVTTGVKYSSQRGICIVVAVIIILLLLILH